MLALPCRCRWKRQLHFRAHASGGLRSGGLATAPTCILQNIVAIISRRHGLFQHVSPRHTSKYKAVEIHNHISTKPPLREARHLGEPLPCHPAAEGALHDPSEFSESSSSQESSSPEDVHFADACTADCHAHHKDPSRQHLSGVPYIR